MEKLLLAVIMTGSVTLFLGDRLPSRTQTRLQVKSEIQSPISRLKDSGVQNQKRHAVVFAF